MANFKAIRDSTTLESVAHSYLRLDLKKEGENLRGTCPRCESDSGRNLVIKTSESGKRYFTCHASKAWGDVISLVAHCHNISIHQAGKDLSKWCSDDSWKPEEAKKEPEALKASPEAKKPAKRNFDPEKYHASLKRGQEDISEFGITAELCEESGAGLCTKGINKGKLAVPVRKADGTLLGYIGISGDVSVPKKWRVA